MKTMKIDDTVVTNEITTHNSSTDFEINEPMRRFINSSRFYLELNPRKNADDIVPK